MSVKILVDENSSKKSVQFAARDEVFFEISKNNWTKSLDEIKPAVYREPSARLVGCVAPHSTLARPNYEGRLNSSNDTGFSLHGLFLILLLMLYRFAASGQLGHSPTYYEVRASIVNGNS